jgi:hypothetical protein
MPTMTSSLCPACGTPNPPHSLFCEKCGTRLIASLNEEPEESESTTPAIIVPKGLSLPTKSASSAEPAAAAAPPESEEELPDWMQVVQAGGTTAELDRAQSVTSDQPVSGAEEIPAWLAGLDTGGETPVEEQKPNADELLPEWTQRLRTLPETDQPAVAEEDEVPDWLKVLGSTGRLPSDEAPLAPGASAPPAPEEKPAWLSEVPAFIESPAAETEELPEWLKEHPQFEEPAEVLPPVVEAKPATDEMPDWLRDLGPAASTTDEALPDWLDELGAEEEPASSSMALSTGDSALDWLSQLSATAPEAQPAEPVAPDWMSSLRTAAPEIDAQPTEEVPAWMSVTSGVETPASPDWMSSFRSAEPAAEVEPEEEGTPDWLTGLGMAAIGAAALDADQAKVEDEPVAEPAPQIKPVTDWLTSLRRATPEMEEEPAQAEAEAAEVPEWLRESGAAPEAAGGPQAYEPEIPDWARESGVSEPSAAAQPEEEGAPDWLQGLGVAAVGAAAIGATQAEPEAEPVPPAKPVTDWLSNLRQATPEMEEEPAGAEAAEFPEWLRDSRAGAGEPPLADQAEEEESVPDWLQGLGAVAAGGAIAGAAPSEPEPESKPATDWLAGLRQVTPEMEAEQAQEEEALPEWLRESGAAPQATGGPQSYDQDIPDWARESGTSEVPTAAQAEEEDVPDWLKGLGMAAAGAAVVGAVQGESEPESKPATDWLSGLRQATPEMEAEQAQEEEALPEWLRESGAAPQALGGPQAYEQEVPEWLRESGASADVSEPAAAPEAEEEGVPDWLKGLGVAAAGAAVVGAAQGEPAPESKPVTDWLSSLRQAAPEMEAEQAAEKEEAEIPEWLRETGAAPQAIGGQQAYEQEVPEWLRDESGVSAPQATAETEGEAGVPDWLQDLGVAATGAAAVAAVSRRSEPTAETEVPDWLREAEPTPAISFEAPTETTEQGEVPEWLRDLTPAAAVAGTAAIAQAEPEEVVEEPEPPEEVEEPEPEPETVGEESDIAKAALAGVAAAAALGAVKGSKAEAAPAEMPSWLKELRQEQEAAQSMIQVPPTEAAGLTQAEIPAWLEALRPQGQPLTPLGAETPSEAEGPLAGIANALPPAPLMGQVQGAPMKLQFETSAEDLARAGVLKELLGQPTAAPASLEQFVVKSSAIRRRALRWTMAALIIFALIIPAARWADFNALTGVDFLPRIDKMVPAPAVSKAADEWRRLPANARVLVVFDYDATQAGELDRIAHLIVSSLAIRNVQIEAASLNPQGLTLAQGVWQKVSHKGASQFTLLDVAPAQASGVQDILARAGKVDLVVELAASPDTVRWWAEQMAVNRLKTPLIAGISAGAEPLTMPYVQSEQVKGLISGWAGAIQYAKATGLLSTYEFTSQMQDYQVPLQGISLANYTLAVLIIIGLIAALFGGKRKGARS